MKTLIHKNVKTLFNIIIIFINSLTVPTVYKTIIPKYSETGVDSFVDFCFVVMLSQVATIIIIDGILIITLGTKQLAALLFLNIIIIFYILFSAFLRVNWNYVIHNTKSGSNPFQDFDNIDSAFYSPTVINYMRYLSSLQNFSLPAYMITHKGMHSYNGNMAQQDAENELYTTEPRINPQEEYTYELPLFYESEGCSSRIYTIHGLGPALSFQWSLYNVQSMFKKIGEPKRAVEEGHIDMTKLLTNAPIYIEDLGGPHKLLLVFENFRMIEPYNVYHSLKCKKFVMEKEVNKDGINKKRKVVKTDAKNSVNHYTFCRSEYPFRVLLAMRGNDKTVPEFTITMTDHIHPDSIIINTKSPAGGRAIIKAGAKIPPEPIQYGHDTPFVRGRDYEKQLKEIIKKPDLGDNMLTSHKNMYSSQGNDYTMIVALFLMVTILVLLRTTQYLMNIIDTQVINSGDKTFLRTIVEKLVDTAERNKITLIPFMLTHKGMRAYNGNAMMVYKKKPQKKPSKKEQIMAIGVDPNAIKNAKNYVKRKSMRPPRVKRYPAVPRFIRETMWLRNLIMNPIHSERSAKLTDANKTNTTTFADFTILDGGINFTISVSDTLSTVAVGVMIYLTYGPVEFGTQSTSSSSAAWRLAMTPINNDGKPILMQTPSANGTYAYEGNNHDQIWTLAESVRMVAAGLRVNSMVSFNTTTDTQFVTKFQAGQLRLADYETWLNGNTSLAAILNSSTGWQRYSNTQGASALYSCLQKPDLWKFFEKENLYFNAEPQAGLVTSNVYYPYVVAYFNEPITPTLTVIPKGVDPIEFVAQMNSSGINQWNKKKVRVAETKQRLLLKNQKGEISNATTNASTINYTNDDSKEKLQFVDVKNKQFVVETEEKYEQDHQIDEKTIECKLINGRLVPINTVEAIVASTYTFALTVEAKYWLEALPLQPTVIQSNPSPSDPNWEKFVWMMQDISNYPLVSDGHSFGDKLIRWGRKNVNPNGVRKASKYIGGMVRSGKAGIADIQQAFYS